MARRSDVRREGGMMTREGIYFKNNDRRPRLAKTIRGKDVVGLVTL
jgi:hypothetical protein